MKLIYSDRAALILRFNRGTTSETNAILWITYVAADIASGKLNPRPLPPYYLLSDNLSPSTVCNFHPFTQNFLWNFSASRTFVSYITSELHGSLKLTWIFSCIVNLPIHRSGLSNMEEIIQGKWAKVIVVCKSSTLAMRTICRYSIFLGSSSICSIAIGRSALKKKAWYERSREVLDKSVYSYSALVHPSIWIILSEFNW